MGPHGGLSMGEGIIQYACKEPVFQAQHSLRWYLLHSHSYTTASLPPFHILMGKSLSPTRSESQHNGDSVPPSPGIGPVILVYMVYLMPS